MGYRILTINPGSTSTKVTLYEDTQLLRSETLYHAAEEFRSKSLIEQIPARMNRVLVFMRGEPQIDAVVGRGGLLHPVSSGPYLVNDDMLSDLSESRYGQHASNLGAFMAREAALLFQTPHPPMVVDPVVVDELDDVARLSGMQDMPRRSLFHALNQKAVARRVAQQLGTSYDRCNLVVAHMGGGITVGAHKMGRVIDVSNGLDGEGPMTPERAGALPVLKLIDFCQKSDLPLAVLEKKLVGAGGLVAHLGTNDFREVEARAETDPGARLVISAMAYQISKEIGRAMATLSGHAEAIVLTGGLAKARPLCSLIEKHVAAFAKVVLVPGEDEALALAEGALRVLRGEEKPLRYERWAA